MSKVDPELTKAFSELQEKKLLTEQKIRLATLEMESLKRSKQHAALTEREITSLVPDTRTYESVGRMFILTPKSKVEENIKKKQVTADEKIKSLENQVSYLENSLQQASNSLRELIRQKKGSQMS